MRDSASDGARVDECEAHRNRLISGIYETVLRQELYDAFMDAWADHVGAAIQDLGTMKEAEALSGRLNEDHDLAAHFDRAFEILEQMGRRLDAAGGPPALGAGAGFAMMISAESEIVQMSPLAREIMGDKPEFALMEAKLTACSRKHLSTLLKVAGLGGVADPLILLTDCHPRHVIARCVRLPDGRVGVTLEALDIQWSDATERALGRSFQLSRAELEVVRQLALGRNLKEVAAVGGRSEHTIRNQVKAVLSKTGTAGQVELMRLVAVLASSGENAAEAPDVQAGPADASPWVPGRNGRSVHVLRFGDPEGKPLLFVHSMLDVAGALRFHEDTLLRRGLHAIVPIRPGYGLSEPWPGPGPMDEQVMDDWAGVLDRLGAERVPVLAHMAGSAHAHRFAARHGDRVESIVAVAGGVPIHSLRQITFMSQRQRVVALTARFATRLLPSILRAGIAQIDTEDVDEFLAALFPKGTHDACVIRGMGIAPLLHREYRFAARQGHFGFAGDAERLVSDWSAAVRAHDRPTMNLHGALDPVVSPQSVREFAGGHPHVDLRVIEGVGQMLLYERPELVLDMIEGVEAA